MTSEVFGTRKPEKEDPGSPSPQSTHSVPTWSLSSRLQPSERAAFAVTSRLLASMIVTESLLRTYYIPIHSEEACGVCIILSAHVMGESPIFTRSLRPADVFAILPLHQEPVYSGMLSAHGRPIWLLDPLDMIPSISDLLTREAGLVIYVCSIHQDCNLEYLLIYVAYLSRFGSLLSSTSPMAAWGFCCSDAEPRSTTLVEKIRLNYHDGRRGEHQSGRGTF